MNQLDVNALLVCVNHNRAGVKEENHEDCEVVLVTRSGGDGVLYASEWPGGRPCNVPAD